MKMMKNRRNNMETKVKVDGKEIDQKEFKDLKEQIENDKSKKLKKINENEFHTLKLLKG